MACAPGCDGLARTPVSAKRKGTASKRQGYRTRSVKEFFRPTRTVSKESIMAKATRHYAKYVLSTLSSAMFSSQLS
ncbi:hypothetical protein ABH935_001557 [Catenulispora sp. GAS73]